ncbi:MAG: right-handed parallel beta-helix repeat-containing protein [Actinobacteria bacterium]|nr:right-handed parallel beta-helix repeat-containing protein [Actinomycetota bacterium]
MANDAGDDTAALKAAIASLGAAGNDTLTLPAGHTYRHSDVLKVGTANVTITGAGTLLATDEARSAVYLAADGITLDGPTLRMQETSGRWEAFEQMKLRLGRFAGITVRNTTVIGSAAAGVYVGGSSSFALTDVTVRDTNADAIHMTLGAHDGVVTRPVVDNPGDDGVAVVSYVGDGELTRNITVQSPTVSNQRWGRGLAVVGGQDVSFTDVSVTESAGAGIYIASEGEWNTFGVNNVTVNGGTLLRSNQQADVDAADRPSPDKSRIVHGAIHLYNSQASQAIRNVTVRNLAIRDTHNDGYDQVQVFSYSGQTQDRLAFENIAISGGSRYNFKTIGIPDGAYRTVNWTKDGAGLPDHVGW